MQNNNSERFFTVEEKEAILTALQNNEAKTSIAKRFNCSVQTLRKLYDPQGYAEYHRQLTEQRRQKRLENNPKRAAKFNLIHNTEDKPKSAPKSVTELKVEQDVAIVAPSDEIRRTTLLIENINNNCERPYQKPSKNIVADLLKSSTPPLTTPAPLNPENSNYHSFVRESVTPIKSATPSLLLTPNEPETRLLDSSAEILPTTVAETAKEKDYLVEKYNSDCAGSKKLSENGAIEAELEPDGVRFICSTCHTRVRVSVSNQYRHVKFCPICGADVRSNESKAADGLSALMSLVSLLPQSRREDFADALRYAMQVLRKDNKI